MKTKPFPENPFVHVFARIAMIDGALILAAIALAVWKNEWMVYALGGGLVLSIAVFVVMNKMFLKELSCPKCKAHIAFEAEKGFVCKNCRIGWEMS